MNFDLPIEQLVRRTDTRFQLGFATEARERVPARDEFVLSASSRGLQVLARNEDGLAAPINVLRQTYGPNLAMEEPQVRLIIGVQVQEPFMHVRISLETAYQDAVKRALLARGATGEEEYARSRLAVLRYEAPLARLIGLPAELVRLTAGTARFWIVLSHYAAVTRGPGGRAA
jgi:predicted membrane GTPase involved in stress response